MFETLVALGIVGLWLGGLFVFLAVLKAVSGGVDRGA